MRTSSRRNKIIIAVGFFYGLVLVFYALFLGVEGPTLPMALATSPLSAPFLVLGILEHSGLRDLIAGVLIFLVGALTTISFFAAPFGWSAMAFFANDVQHPRRRLIAATVLVGHYIGIALWFYAFGAHYLLRPFFLYPQPYRGPQLSNLFPLEFYVVGQILLWWTLLRSVVRIRW